jgi:hypothetical protein
MLPSGRAICKPTRRPYRGLVPLTWGPSLSQLALQGLATHPLCLNPGFPAPLHILAFCSWCRIDMLRGTRPIQLLAPQAVVARHVRGCGNPFQKSRSHPVWSCTKYYSLDVSGGGEDLTDVSFTFLKTHEFVVCFLLATPDGTLTHPRGLDQRRSATASEMPSWSAGGDAYNELPCLRVGAVPTPPKCTALRAGNYFAELCKAW